MDTIQQIKSRLNFQGLADREGIRLIPAGKGKYKALCPFHSEKTPSFCINESGKGKKGFICFGCGTQGGDVINLYALLHNIDNEKAISELYFSLFGHRGRAKEPIDNYVGGFKSTLEALGGLKMHFERQNNERPPHEILLSLKCFSGELSPDSRAYLNKRGIKDETIADFGVFDIKDYEKTMAFLKGTFSPERLAPLFTGEKGNIFRFTQHKIIFPVIEDGKIVGLNGRYFLNGNDKTKRGKYRTTTGVEGKLFNSDILPTLSSGSRVFLCEGVIDTMTLSQEGKNAVGLVSVTFYSEEVAERLKDFDLIIALDNDDAGERYARKIHDEFYWKTGKNAKINSLPSGVKDINEYF